MEKYKLKKTLQWGDEEITELSFRKPKGKDLYELPAEPKTEDFAKIASKLSNTPFPAIGELELEDFMKVIEIVGNLVAPSLETGDQPSL